MDHVVCDLMQGRLCCLTPRMEQARSTGLRSGDGRKGAVDHTSAPPLLLLNFLYILLILS